MKNKLTVYIDPAKGDDICVICISKGSLREFIYPGITQDYILELQNKNNILINLLNEIHKHYLKWPGFCPIIHKKVKSFLKG